MRMGTVPRRLRLCTIARHQALEKAGCRPFHFPASLMSAARPALAAAIAAASQMDQSQVCSQSLPCHAVCIPLLPCHAVCIPSRHMHFPSRAGKISSLQSSIYTNADALKCYGSLPQMWLLSPMQLRCISRTPPHSRSPSTLCQRKSSATSTLFQR